MAHSLNLRGNFSGPASFPASPDFSVLSITTVAGRYERKVKAQGLAPGAQPIVLSPAGQG